MQKADKEWGTRESGEDGKRRRREGESLVPLPVVAHRPEADEFSQKKKINYLHFRCHKLYPSDLPRGLIDAF